MRRRTLAAAFLLAAAAAASGGDRPPIFAPRRGLVHPLLDVDMQLCRGSDCLDALQAKVAALIAEFKKGGALTEASVEYTDLDEAQGFALEGDAPFKPASMAKLPIMMAFLKQQDTDPDILTRRTRARAMPAAEFVPLFASRARLGIGREYSVDELLRAMISRSDNDAAFTLMAFIGSTELHRIYADMGTTGPDAEHPTMPISTKGLARMLRTAYYASYLNWEMSQKAMEYLAATEFDLGLRARLPPGLTVANKYGEAAIEGSDEKQIHDCGIIFLPRKPYLLCVMTKGRDQRLQADAIAQISELVYNETEARVSKASAASPKPAP